MRTIQSSFYAKVVLTVLLALNSSGCAMMFSGLANSDFFAVASTLGGGLLLMRLTQGSTGAAGKIVGLFGIFLFLCG